MVFFQIQKVEHSNWLKFKQIEKLAENKANVLLSSWLVKYADLHFEYC